MAPTYVTIPTVILRKWKTLEMMCCLWWLSDNRFRIKVANKQQLLKYMYFVINYFMTYHVNDNLVKELTDVLLHKSHDVSIYCITIHLQIPFVVLCLKISVVCCMSRTQSLVSEFQFIHVWIWWLGIKKCSFDATKQLACISPPHPKYIQHYSMLTNIIYELQRKERWRRMRYLWSACIPSVSESVTCCLAFRG